MIPTVPNTCTNKDPVAGTGFPQLDQERVRDFRTFQAASSRFEQAATEMMAGVMRIQLLMLDDTRLALSEMADILSQATRNRR